jgi:hypothetical protein
MDCLPRILIISSVVFLISLTLIAGCTQNPVPGSFRTHYEYKIQVVSNEPITNATFYLPLPVKKGIPTVGPVELGQIDFQKENYSVDIVRDAPGLNLTGTYPVQNNEPRFLKITTNGSDPDAEQNYAYAVAMDNFTKPDMPFSFIDTAYAMINESVILPKRLSSSPVPVAMTNKTSTQWITYTEIDIPQTIPIYASYDASSSATVTISSDIRIMNEWHQEDDSWGSNDYWEYFEWSHTGASRGWQTASGLFRAARGVYPNLEHPAWQKFKNRTLSK